MTLTGRLRPLWREAQHIWDRVFHARRMTGLALRAAERAALRLDADALVHPSDPQTCLIIPRSIGPVFMLCWPEASPEEVQIRGYRVTADCQPDEDVLDDPHRPHPLVGERGELIDGVKLAWFAHLSEDGATSYTLRYRSRTRQYVWSVGRVGRYGLSFSGRMSADAVVEAVSTQLADDMSRFGGLAPVSPAHAARGGNDNISETPDL
ncbi:hypothetical protein RMQ97_00420 [Maricaulis sp. D1M11]|uniref:hypothetical protein n=1 Tax=Maricaulis sp. D1M11 TaxID=3076117 RepID=UPI0039B4BD7F